MKKIKFSSKLSLNKSTVSELNSVIGGKAEKTKTGPAVCTAMVTFACCIDETRDKKCDDTKTGPGVCTAMVTFACC